MYIPVHLFTISVLKSWPFSPFSSYVWTTKGEHNSTAPTNHHVPAEEEAVINLFTAQFQGSPKRRPLLRVSFLTGKDVVSYKSSAPLRTVKTMQRILWGEPQGSFHAHMDPFKTKLLWGTSEQEKLRCPPLQGMWHQGKLVQRIWYTKLTRCFGAWLRPRKR